MLMLGTKTEAALSEPLIIETVRGVRCRFGKSKP